MTLGCFRCYTNLNVTAKGVFLLADILSSCIRSVLTSSVSGTEEGGDEEGGDEEGGDEEGGDEEAWCEPAVWVGFQFPEVKDLFKKKKKRDTD